MEEKKKERNKGGRPKKEVARTHKMGFNATPLEFDRIKGKAYQAGLKVADYLRDCALRAKPRKTLSEEQRKHYQVLAGLANNLNQLTKEAHKQNLPSLAPILLRTLNEINTTLKQMQHDN